MESPGTKQQTFSMDTTTQSYLHTELERRRTSLQAAAGANVSDASLRNLINSVDDALARLKGGTYGICEVCHDSIEADRLICNPLLRFCLDHLSSDEQRALERDMVLAAGIQRGLLPRVLKFHSAVAADVSRRIIPGKYTIFAPTDVGGYDYSNTASFRFRTFFPGNKLPY